MNSINRIFFEQTSPWQRGKPYDPGLQLSHLWPSMFGRHTHCPDTGSQEVKREPSTEQWHAETEKITCYSRQSFPLPVIRVTWLTCAAGVRVVSGGTLVTFGATVVGSAVTLTRHATAGVQRCVRVTSAHWEKGLNHWVKTNRAVLDVYSVCVCLTLAVWIRVEAWATLLTARTGELRPAQTLTDRVTHLRKRAHNTATTIYRQTQREIRVKLEC